MVKPLDFAVNAVIQASELGWLNILVTVCFSSCVREPLSGHSSLQLRQLAASVRLVQLAMVARWLLLVCIMLAVKLASLQVIIRPNTAPVTTAFDSSLALGSEDIKSEDPRVRKEVSGCSISEQVCWSRS